MRIRFKSFVLLMKIIKSLYYLFFLSFDICTFVIVFTLTDFVRYINIVIIVNIYRK